MKNLSKSDNKRVILKCKIDEAGYLIGENNNYVQDFYGNMIKMTYDQFNYFINHNLIQMI